MSGKKTIMVVDDQKLNRTIVCRILRADDFETLEAENGLEAQKILQSGNYDVELILLDIVMPQMDGYAFLGWMNETGLIKKIPVIVTTGNDDSGAEIHCLEIGASDFIRKPYNAELVRHRVRSLVRLWDNAALLNRLETDRLTGVYSSEFFYSHVEEILSKNPDTQYYIVYADVDDFKMINARYGTSAGDELLKYLADDFKKQTASGGICGRISADRFVMLFDQLAKRTQAEVENIYNTDYNDAPVKGFQLKCGIYNITDRSLPVSEMCDRAKLAASSIKHQYGVYYAVYDDSMMQRAVREHQLADCMEQALQENQFVVYFQPKHSTRTGALAGAEALVRWNHPQLGFISPGEFIPLFERNGFVTNLDAFVLKETCKVQRKWLDEKKTLVPISVNISRADFISESLPARIEQTVDSYNLPHGLIHIEVTESAYTNNPQQIVTAVSVLQNKGFLIEMDDFGSGYSSLNMLSELPIDILKLDMRFIQSGNDRLKDGKRNILSFILSLSKWLQLSTVAEGVETKGEFEQLKAMDCDLIQGYYFAKPMPSIEFEKYMAEHHIDCPELYGGSSSAADRREAVSDTGKPSCCLSLYDAIKKGDFKEAAEKAEIMKNAAECLNMKRLYDDFRLLEEALSGGRVEEAQALMPTVARDCGEAVAAQR